MDRQISYYSYPGPRTSKLDVLLDGFVRGHPSRAVKTFLGDDPSRSEMFAGLMVSLSFVRDSELRKSLGVCLKLLVDNNLAAAIEPSILLEGLAIVGGFKGLPRNQEIFADNSGPIFWEAELRACVTLGQAEEAKILLQLSDGTMNNQFEQIQTVRLLILQGKYTDAYDLWSSVGRDDSAVLLELLNTAMRAGESAFVAQLESELRHVPAAYVLRHSLEGRIARWQGRRFRQLAAFVRTAYWGTKNIIAATTLSRNLDNAIRELVKSR